MNSPSASMPQESAQVPRLPRMTTIETYLQRIFLISLSMPESGSLERAIRTPSLKIRLGRHCSLLGLQALDIRD
jgi:hypothetical protein